MSNPVPSCQDCETAKTLTVKSLGSCSECLALNILKKKLTLPDAGMEPADLSAETLLMGNSIKTRDNSAEAVVC